MSTNDGGPAFPQQHGHWQEAHGGETKDRIYVGRTGMSLRDWLAGKAMQGILSGLDWKDKNQVDVVLSLSRQYADAMLAQREKKP